MNVPDNHFWAGVFQTLALAGVGVFLGALVASGATALALHALAAPWHVLIEALKGNAP